MTLFRLPPRAGLLLLLAAWIMAGTHSFAQTAPDSPLKAHLLVVYNSNDPDAKELAEYYAERREIPLERILPIACPVREIVSRQEFDKTVRAPIEDYLLKKGWLKRTKGTLPFGKGEITVQQAVKNEIWAMALIRGIPLKIEHDATIQAPTEMDSRVSTNGASVDSELALLPYDGLPLPGFIGNLYSADSSRGTNPFVSIQPRPFTKDFANFMILVTRLDAPKPQQVRTMIDNTLIAEDLELTGRAYFDARGLTDAKDGYLMGDEWIRRTADIFRISGFETTLDNNPDVVSAKVPWQDVAFYAGWYAANLEGPFTQPDFSFRPGAIAYHIHSFSGNTIRSEKSDMENWVGPLLSRGVTATMGCVYEPYLSFTPNVSIFFTSLLHGLTFAEAAYQSQIALSWMTTIVGDPLYRPFPRNFYDNLAMATNEKHPDLDWLLMRQARLASEAGLVSETKDRIKRMVQTHPSTLTWESAADIWSKISPDGPEAIEAYQKAIEMAEDDKRKIRISLKLGQVYQQRGQSSKAIELFEGLISRDPKNAAAYDLPDILARLTGSRPPSKPAETSPPASIKPLAPVLKPAIEPLPQNKPMSPSLP